MEPIYKKEFQVRPTETDRFKRLKLSALLLYIQQVGCEHSNALSYTYESMAQQGIFWAVIRHRLQITRLPLEDEIIHVETWPMPTTRAAYPRATVAYDGQGNVLFRSVCLWILMDLKDRSMLLPKNSGVEIEGILRGNELSRPQSLASRPMEHCLSRKVVFSDLDRNSHMNNTRYLDWCQDLLDSDFHSSHPPKAVTMCYINEALEGQQLELNYTLDADCKLHVDIHREKAGTPDDYDRVFTARIEY